MAGKLDPLKFLVDPLNLMFQTFKGSKNLGWDPLNSELSANPAHDQICFSVAHFKFKFRTKLLNWSSENVHSFLLFGF